MPSTPYDLVQDDQDLRVPLHAEQAFFHGITFQAKLNTSTMIVGEPESRIDRSTLFQRYCDEIRTR
uniref:Uncharacterized protein n=1 Tax=Glossina palpalis gambiensis TaxID=67801 RepID=A0A1B0BC41_9MUSC